MGGEFTNEERLLTTAVEHLSGIQSNGAFGSFNLGGISITGTTAPSSANITSTSVDVSRAAASTILYDVTGATTGVIISWYGGVSGSTMLLLRSVTAVNTSYGFLLGGATTGGSQDTTGVSRVEDVHFVLALSANTGNGTGVLATVRATVLTQPST